jgi:two-component system, OmpR family, alkaline phosphatase synthesis response regulator PhoP
MAKKILLCDDDVNILRAAEFKLKKAGYAVRTAFDGEAGWEAILVETPDMLVTDFQMPRLDGVGLIARVRDCAALSELPCVLLTAKGLELDQPGLIARWRLAAFFFKPFSPRELLACVERTIGRPMNELSREARVS